MGNLKEIILALSTVAVLSGCATAAPDMSSTPSDIYDVKVASISVDNFAQETDKIENGAFSNDYNRLPSDSTKPAFPNLVYERIEQQLRASGNEGELEIAVLNADLLYKARAADSIPFIAIASALSDREHMCRVSANFKYDGKSVRREFESIQTLGQHWVDTDPEIKSVMINDCLNEILSKIHDFTVNLTRR